MDRQIRIALTVPELGVGQSAMGPFGAVLQHLPLGPRERPERLGQQGELGAADGDLARPGTHQGAPHPDVIVQVEQLDHRPGVDQRIGSEIHLDPATGILQVAEDHFPLGTPRLDPSGDAHLRAVFAHGILVQGRRRAGAVGPVEAVGKGAHAEAHELGQLRAASLLDKGAIVGHAARCPKRFRYASMNSSMSPSITRCTSLTLSSVR